MREHVQCKDFGTLPYTGEEIAFAMIAAASEQGISYACWRLPAHSELSVLIDFSEIPLQKKAQLEKSEQGFIVQSFLQENNEDSIFLKADILFTTTSKTFTESVDLKDPFLKESFLKSVMEKLISGKCYVIFPEVKDQEFHTNLKEHYTSLVEKAKTSILENRFKKIVLARSKEVKLPFVLNLPILFKQLRTEYSNAFISLVSTKLTGVWLTATPEILASIDQQGVFRTIALAGTQLLKEGNSIQKAVWTQKEIEEQALVGRYIINCFKKIRLREYEEEGPRTVQSGNLLHLRTDYTVNTRDLNFPELGTVMLELLHPTSAVCGMPKEVTLAFIKEHENLERKLFSGYLGPVNIHSESHIFVNLRCAQLFADRAILYAGAGVTQDSEPEKEYKETELKMEAVGRFLTDNQ